MRFYAEEPADTDDPQDDEYTVIEPNSAGKYVLTWDFPETDDPVNLIQIVVTSEAAEATTWITVADGTAPAEEPEDTPDG